MLKISLILIVLQSSINEAGNNKVGGSEDGGNKTNLSNSSAFKKSIKVDYPTSNGAKKGGSNSYSGGGNIKKGVQAARGSVYLNLDAKKAFNVLRHVFTQLSILQHFDLEQHI